MSATVWTGKAESGGYEQAHGNREVAPGKWINTGRVRLHRLAAVAWFGWESIEGREVHHRINIPWLNVEPNLLPIDAPEHSILTGDRVRNGPRDTVVDDVLDGLGGGVDG